MPIEDTHPDYTDNLPRWTRVRDAISGSDAIKAKEEVYLPRPAQMQTRRYQPYLQRAQWYDVTERTLVGLRGAMFQQEPAITGDTRVVAQMNDLSMRGLTFNGMARKIARETLSVGRIGALLDPGLDDAVAVMPRVALYRAENITDWDTQLIGGKMTLTRVVLQEPEFKDIKTQNKQYRELLLDPEGGYVVNLWRKQGEAQEFTIVADESGPVLVRGQKLDFIPFIFFGVNDLDPDIEKPPLLGLAEENIAHFQLQADYRHAIYLGGQPTPWGTGIKPEEKPGAIGSGEFWGFANPDAKLGMLEFEGKSIESMRQAIIDSEGRMVLLGARFFEPTKQGVEAAESIRLKFSADSATLTTISQTEGEGLERMLNWGARMASLGEDMQVKMGEDFLSIQMTPEELTAAVNAWSRNAMAFTDLFALMQRGNLIAEGRTQEEVRAEIQTTAPVIPPTENTAPPTE